MNLYADRDKLKMENVSNLTSGYRLLTESKRVVSKKNSETKNYVATDKRGTSCRRKASQP